MTLYEEFINDVLEFPEKYTEYVKLGVKRHLDDLKKDWEFEWSKKTADEYISYIECFKFTKGVWYGKPFKLAGYQAFILAVKYGWLRKGTELRRFKFSYQTEPRGGGKSEFSGAQMVKNTFFDNEPAPVGLIAATKWEQARYIFDPCVSMVQQLSKESELFASRSKVMQYEIKELQTAGYITKISANATKEDGANPHYAVVDEFHAHDDDSVLKVIETGAMKRLNALTDVVTTAGFNKFGPDYNLRQVAKKILKGQIKNDSFFAWVNEPDPDDDPHDEKTWYKLNLNLGNTPDFFSFKANYQNAVAQGSSAWNEFLTKNLNQYVDGVSVWIDSEILKECIKHFDDDELIGQRCFIGLDLSSKIDLTAVCYYFPDIKYFRVKFYCPKDKISAGRRVDGVDYLDFMKSGNLVATPGNVIDYDYILNDIFDSAAIYNIDMVAYDPFNADLLIPKIESAGLKCGAIRQGFLTLSPATKRLEVNVLKKEIYHEGCPIMAWNFANVELETDAAGNIKPSKKLSKNKIDGVAALVTAIGGYMHVEIQGDDVISMEDLKKMYG